LPFYLGLLQSQDADGIRLALHQALSNMGLRGFVTEVVAPLNHMVGLAWARGDLAVHQEHLYTECVSTTMRQAIAAIAAMAPVAQGAAPKVLLTTFPQEAHGLGLLMVESLLALQGCQCVSLGTQMPVRDIAQAAAAHKVGVVALSFSANMNANQVVDGLLELNALLPNDVALWAGGSAPVLRRRPIEGVLVLHDLDAISGAVNQYRRALTPLENKAA
jgi:methanogenic corrinoid protein MtbC1